MRSSKVVALIFFGLLAALFFGSYFWQPFSLACAVTFLILGAIAGFIPDCGRNHKIGGTDC
ncbi:MAG: hypothetical protein QMD66_06715 [Actinomycetota bacterium]|nr:hypothetical protein [Actinomycetota bacterium]